MVGGQEGKVEGGERMRFSAMGEEVSDKVMMLGAFVEYRMAYGGIVGGVRGEGEATEVNEVDGTRYLQGGEGSGVVRSWAVRRGEMVLYVVRGRP